MFQLVLPLLKSLGKSGTSLQWQVTDRSIDNGTATYMNEHLKSLCTVKYLTVPEKNPP